MLSGRSFSKLLRKPHSGQKDLWFVRYREREGRNRVGSDLRTTAIVVDSAS